ncbi:ABC1 family protein Mcp2p [[Candida] anglica]|uniref:ABC1 family protein Mcp2p n=1 Tax=[Candida] anglica TaxID=148631 RepID=A0ABP0EAE0_9ASCO
MIGGIRGFPKHGTIWSRHAHRNMKLYSPRSFRAYSVPPVAPKRQTQKLFKVGLGVGLVGSLLYATNDTVHNNVRHVVLTAERIGVVTVATIRCFSLYRKTIFAEYENDKERLKAFSETHSKAAAIALKALEKNGGIYIKLGQHVSALTYLLPSEWTETMVPLQDRCPMSSLEDIENMFQRDLGCSISEKFQDFDPNPVGVASLAQVHIATLRKTGEKVAVKIQHPSLQEFVPIDIYMTQTVFGLMHKVFPEYPLSWLGDELQSSIYVELDFTNEAQNAERTSQYFQNFQEVTALKIPNIISAQPRIMIMEYVAGARLDDLEYMKKHNINTSEVSSCLSHIFNNMVFTPGVGLHCDPHGGNLAIRAVEKSVHHHNFEIVLYDHGLYRQIPLQMKRDYSHFWLSVLDNDVPKMRMYSEKIAGITTDQKFKIFASAITGRDSNTALSYDITKTRTSEEMDSMRESLHGQAGVLEDLMEMLSSMPRVVLLILKTNDLTRNLDENLNNPLGPERTFLIMASYCARVVYDEQKEIITKSYGHWSASSILYSIKNWWSYQNRLRSLYIYDWLMLLRNLKARLL